MVRNDSMLTTKAPGGRAALTSGSSGSRSNKTLGSRGQLRQRRGAAIKAVVVNVVREGQRGEVECEWAISKRLAFSRFMNNDFEQFKQGLGKFGRRMP